MKNLAKLAIVLGITLLGTGFLFAQPGRALHQSDITQLYDAKSEATFEGTISKVTVAESGYGRFAGVIIDLKTADKVVKAYIAPDWYLKDEKIELKTEKSIRLIGSQVTHNNQPLIISRNIKYDGKEITFRDNKGTPVWAGKAMGPGAGRGKGKRNR